MHPSSAARLALAALLLAPGLCGAQEDPGATGPHAVAKLRLKVAGVGWFGTRLDVRYPRDLAGPRPVVLICHGFLAWSSKFVPLAEHLASRGFVAASFQQPNVLSNDTPKWARQLRKGLETLLAAGQDPASPLRGRLDPARVALLGHSFGAAACVVLASEEPGLRGVVCLAPVNQKHRALLLARGAALRVPLLTITGQRDPLARTKDYVHPLFQGAALSPRRAFLEVKGGGHDLYVGNGERARLARRHATAWLEWILGARPLDAWTSGQRARLELEQGSLSRVDHAAAGGLLSALPGQ
mgnify:CR=1 FL=1